MEGNHAGVGFLCTALFLALIVETTGEPPALLFNCDCCACAYTKNVSTGSLDFVEDSSPVAVTGGDMRIKYPNVTGRLLTRASIDLTGADLTPSEKIELSHSVTSFGLTLVAETPTTIEISGAASLDIYEHALNNVTYSNTDDLYGVAARFVNFTVWDGSYQVSATITIRLIDRVKPPVVCNAMPEVAYTEGNAYVNVSSELTISDDGKVQGIYVVISNAKDGDRLVYHGDDDLVESSSSIVMSSHQNLTSFSFRTAASPAVYNSVLRRIAFTNTLPAPAHLNGETRTITFLVTDESGSSTVVVVSVGIVLVNDPPAFLVDGLRRRNATYEAGGDPVRLFPDDVDVALSDPEGDERAWRVEIDVAPPYLGNRVNVSNADVLRTVTEVVSVSRTTYTGVASFGDYERILRQLQYSSETPVPGYVTVSITIWGPRRRTESDPVNVVIFTNISSCSGLPCSVLDVPVNGSRDGGDSTCSWTALFACDECFEIANGSLSRTCDPETGNFTGTQPTCKFVQTTCDPLPQPENGFISASSSNEPSPCGDTVEFWCDTCHRLSGSATRTCLSSGEWSGTQPTCEFKSDLTCPRFRPPPNGYVEANGTGCDARTLFQCDPGYVVIGELGSICRESSSDKEVLEWCTTSFQCLGVVNVALTVRDETTGDSLRGARVVIYARDSTTMDEYATIESLNDTFVVAVPVDYELIVLVAGLSNYAPSTVSYRPIFGGDQSLDLFVSPMTSFDDYRRVLVNVSASSLAGLPSLSLADGTLLDVLDARAIFSSDYDGTLADVFNETTIPLDNTRPLLTFNVVDEAVEVRRYDFNAFAWELVSTNASSFVVEAYGWWIATVARRPIDDALTCVSASFFYRASVVDDRPLAYASVAWNGEDYGHWSVATADANGRLCVVVPVWSSTIMLVDTSRAALSTQTFSLTVESAGNSTSQCGGNCSTHINVTVVDCGGLDSPDGGFASQTSTLSLFGSVSVLAVTEFQCKRGHRLTGASRATCLWNGTWSATPPDCPIVDCGPLFAPEDGSVHFANSSTTFDSVVTFGCDVGYELQGSSSLRCQENGNWSYAQPTCKIVNCPDFGPVSHGMISKGSTTYLSKRFLECEDGYEPTTVAVFTCEANGNWDYSNPECKAIVCEGTLADPVNSYLSQGLTNELGFELYYSCNDCHEKVDGDTVVKCGIERVWKGKPAVCEEVNCDSLDRPDNGWIRNINSSSTCATIYQFGCNVGYNLIGSAYVQCPGKVKIESENDLGWNGTEGHCQIVDCGRLDVPQNGDVFGDATTYNSTLRFDCDECYRLEGSTERVCSANGTWNGTQTTCHLVHCSPLQVSDNGRVSTNSTSCGTTASFECDRGYSIEGSTQRTCMENGTWSGTETQCKILDCYDVDVPNSRKKATGTVFQSLMSFECEACFLMFGSSEIECLESGEWSTKDIQCRPRECSPPDHPDNGRRVGANWTCSATVEFECDDGYYLVGSSNRTCRPNGRWDGERTECHPEDCGKPKNPRNGRAEYSETTYLSMAIITCDECCEPADVYNTTCLASGEWSRPYPVCREIDACESSPCRHGGGCVDLFEGYRCFCTSEFVGQQCEIESSSFGICGIQECSSFVSTARLSFSCGDDSYLETFVANLCDMLTNGSLSLLASGWGQSVWTCVVASIANVVDDVYGDRIDSPFASECQETNRILYERQSQCLDEGLCQTAFTAADAAIVTSQWLDGLPVFRDRAVAQLLKLVRACGENATNVAPLRRELEAAGFVICLQVTAANISEAIKKADGLRRLIREQTGAEMVLLENGDIQCNAESGRRRRRREVAFDIAILSNGTNALSSESLCNNGLNNVTSGNGVEVVCPECGNGETELPSESCDDGNVVDGDGCSSNCTIEPSASCSVELSGPSQCVNVSCGDGVRAAGEECDTGGESAGCKNCTIVFECSENEPFERSLCTLCGNEIVNDDEECDNGRSAAGVVDGCDDNHDACVVDPFFDCFGGVGERSYCEHFAVDMDEESTRIYFNHTVLVFLGEPGRVNASKYGDKDWSLVTVEYVGFEDGVDLLSERWKRAVFSSIQGNGTDIRRVSDATMVIERIANYSVKLETIILTLGFLHADNNGSEPAFKTRFALVTVTDANRVSSPAINISLRYVGANTNSPSLQIPDNLHVLTEDTPEPVVVTRGSLTLVDADSDFYYTQAAVVHIGSRRNSLDERLEIDSSAAPNLQVKNVDGSRIEINGSASPSDYAAILNNVTYIHYFRTPFDLPDAVITFTVWDDDFSASVNVTVELRANFIPVVASNGAGIVDGVYRETGQPVGLMYPIEIIDEDHRLVENVSVVLLNPQPGDRIALDAFAQLNSSLSAVVFTADVIILAGRAHPGVYEAALSSLQFSNTLPRPANVSATTRQIHVIVWDKLNASLPFVFNVSVLTFNDPPEIEFANANWIFDWLRQELIQLVPSNATLFDADNHLMTEAYISFVHKRSGDVIDVDDFEAVGIQKNRLANGDIVMNGTSNKENYLAAIKSTTYTTSDVVDGYTVVNFSVVDAGGAVSSPVSVTVETNTTCRLLPCDPLPDLSNVTALTHSVGRSTCHPKAYFSCSPCYHLIGSPNITCLENGNWTGGVPACELKMCESLSSPEYGLVHVDNYACGSTANYYCDDYFALVGNSTRTCSPDEIWNGTEPRCLLINKIPEVTFSGNLSSTVSFAEGGLSVGLPQPILVADQDHDVLIRAVVILSHARVGDRLLVNQNLSTENVTIDVDANGLSIIVEGKANLTYYREILSTVQFSNAFPRPANVSDSSRLVTVTVSDEFNTSTPAVIEVLVHIFNDLPILTPSVSHTNFTDGEPPISLLDPSTSLRDEDNRLASEANLTVIDGHPSGDRLLVNVSLANQLNINVTGISTSSMIFSGLAPLDHYVQLLLSVTYQYFGLEPTSELKRVVVTVTDSGGAVSEPLWVVCRLFGVDPFTNFVLIIASNGVDQASGTYYETGSPVGLANRIEIFDKDHYNVERASVVLLNPQLGDKIILDSGNSSLSIASTDNTITLSGSAVPEVYESALSTLQFLNTLPSPANLSGITRHIRVTVWDKWNVSEPFSFTVSIVLHNDPPQLRFTDPNLTFDWLRQSFIQLVPSDATLFDADNHLMIEAYLSFVHKRSGDVIDVDDFEAVGIQKYRLANGDIVMNGTSSKENYLAAIKSTTYMTSDVVDDYTVVNFSVVDAGGAPSSLISVTLKTNTTCRLLPCDPLPDLSNVTALTYSVGRSTCHPKAYFSCSPCYHLIGSPEITCLENGNWTDGVSTCELKRCEMLYPPTYGRMTAENRTCGSTAVFSCNDYFALVGSSTRTCLPNEMWNGTQPYCSLINQHPMVTFAGHIVSDIVFTEGEAPVNLPQPVFVDDPDHANLIRAVVTLSHAHHGDQLLVNQSMLADDVTIRIDDAGLSITIEGNTNLSYYQQILSTVQFSNWHHRPANVSNSSRLITVIVFDEFNASAPATIEVHVHVYNDKPMIEIHHPNATYVEDGPPVHFLDPSTSLRDEDDHLMSEANVAVIDGHARNDKLFVNETLAANLGISVRGVSSATLTLSGVAPSEQYVQLLSTVMYQNLRPEPSTELKFVSVTVTDSGGAVSEPASICILTSLVNDLPGLDFGSGVGVNDEISFVEGQAVGIHIASRPHRIRIVDPEGDSIKGCTVRLTADNSSLLDDEEYIYTFKDLPPGITMAFDPSGKLLTFSGVASASAYASVLQRIFYANIAEEPRIVVNFTSNEKIRRQIIIELTSNASSIPVIGIVDVDVVPVNDHAPVLLIKAAGDCVSVGRPRVRARRSTSKEKEKRTTVSPSTSTVAAPQVRLVELVSPPLESFGVAGSSIVVHFSQETNKPGLLGKTRLSRVLSITGIDAERSDVIAEWRDDQTLVLLFPKLLRGMIAEDLSVAFSGGGCDFEDCENGICHLGGHSCSVGGVYKPATPVL